MRVLICDDEASIRLLYRLGFEEHGAEVVEADDGDACLAALERGSPDVVVLDLFMPGGRDGLSVLPELRRRCPTSSIYVVSAHASAETFGRCRRRGATACFEKLGFAARIPRVLERHRGAA